MELGTDEAPFSAHQHPATGYMRLGVEAVMDHPSETDPRLGRDSEQIIQCHTEVKHKHKESGLGTTLVTRSVQQPTENIPIIGTIR